MTVHREIAQFHTREFQKEGRPLRGDSSRGLAPLIVEWVRQASEPSL
jgi:hypothetical protein